MSPAGKLVFLGFHEFSLSTFKVYPVAAFHYPG
jgi:hypothetical protein